MSIFLTLGLRYPSFSSLAATEDKLLDCLAEVPKVRKDCGYPPLVTPTSQIVGTQAVWNILLGRYKTITAQYKDLILGKYGA